MVTSENEQTDPSEESADEDVATVGTAVADKPWFRRPATLAVLGLLAAALVAALVFVVGRDSSSPSSGSAAMTIPEYFSANDITVTPVRRGDPGTPVISFTVPRGWSDAGPDAPEGAYGAAFYDNSVDPDYPPSIVVLLSKLSGNADPAKILEYAPGELESLPDYIVGSRPMTSTLSGFDAVQLSGLYTREDGEQRLIAQKTVVIPASDGLYVLQMNADAPTAEAPVLQEATVLLDEGSKITAAP
jgi:hypothetical protein